MSYFYNDLLGQVFGRLTVIEKTDHRYCKKIYWVCQCVKMALTTPVKTSRSNQVS